MLAHDFPAVFLTGGIAPPSELTRETDRAAVPLISTPLNGARLIVVDPRQTEMTRFAELWLHREEPGTDTALFNEMAQVIVAEMLYDETFVHRRARKVFRNTPPA